MTVGSGISIYVIASLGFNASFFMDEGPAIIKYNDYGPPCEVGGPSNCYNTLAYDIQSLMFGDHVLVISTFPLLTGSRTDYSHFHLDYAAVNETHAAHSTITLPNPSTSPTSSILPGSRHQSQYVLIT